MKEEAYWALKELSARTLESRQLNGLPGPNDISKLIPFLKTCPITSPYEASVIPREVRKTKRFGSASLSTNPL